jgi:hypothetical protein
VIISLPFALNNNTSSAPVGSYWTDSATSKLVSEVLLALEQQQQQQHEEQEAVYWAGISSSISTEQQLLTFWRRVMPSAEALSCDQY